LDLQPAPFQLGTLPTSQLNPCPSDNNPVSAGTLTENHLNEATPRKTTASGFISAIYIGLLTLILAATAWLFFQSRTQADHFASLLLMQTVSTSIGGILAVVLAGFITWNHINKVRTHRLRTEYEELQSRLKTAQAEIQKANAQREKLDHKLKELSTNIENTIQDRINKMATTQEQLQQQLRDRQRSERMMAMQAKELERSKDVLELHVQNRTLEIQKLQQRYESMLNSAGEGIYGLDLQGRINFVNPATAAITGWRPEEMIGRWEGEVFRHDTSNLTRVTDSTDRSRTDCELFYRRDGSTFPVEYTCAPITECNREIGTVVVFKDITERKRAEDTLSRKAAELARSNAELEQFAYVASHDLQEPLRKIQAFGDRLKAKVDAVGLQDGRDYLDRMQGAAARMSTLISDLLTFSRVISASQPFVSVDLNTVAKGVLSDLEVRIEQTKAKVEVGSLPAIEADPMQMRQLLQNLIGNALKFQPPDAQPHIQITAQILKNPFAGSPEEDPYAEQCELTVQDNGIGFDEKYSEKIFAVFQRLHGRTEFEGTGVGLAVCRRITDRHGGTIRAQSKAGEGAKFIVTVPVRHPKKEQVPS
jgi:two-component system sensor kinase FixL